MVTGFHRKEKVGPVSIRAYPNSINSESDWLDSCYADVNMVCRGIADYVYQRLPDCRFGRWVLFLVRFYVEANFIRSATGGTECSCRRSLSKSW
jgi:hypothetical protein